MSRIVSFSRSRLSSSMTSPRKFGWGKLTTSICTGPVVRYGVPGAAGAATSSRGWMESAESGTEHLLLLVVELGLGEDSGVEQLLELHQLVVGVLRGGHRRLWSNLCLRRRRLLGRLLLRGLLLRCRLLGLPVLRRDMRRRSQHR